jgi:hypothetical protein
MARAAAWCARVGLVGRVLRISLVGVLALIADRRYVGNGRWLWIAAGLSLLAVTLALATLTARSEAAFPGEPGKISFDSTRDGNTEIYVMNADGSGQNRLTNELAIDRDAASPQTAGGSPSSASAMEIARSTS